MGTYPPVTPEEQLRALAAGHVGVLETLARMQLGALERSKLDEERYLLVRLAALVATDATPISYRAHLGGAGDLPTAKVVGTLAAIAPMTGSARVLAAASNLAAAGLLPPVLRDPPHFTPNG
jgi:4-carboxymuconolactone decarboxylase